MTAGDKGKLFPSFYSFIHKIVCSPWCNTLLHVAKRKVMSTTLLSVHNAKMLRRKPEFTRTSHLTYSETVSNGHWIYTPKERKHHADTRLSHAKHARHELTQDFLPKLFNIKHAWSRWVILLPISGFLWGENSFWCHRRVVKRSKQTKTTVTVNESSNRFSLARMTSNSHWMHSHQFSYLCDAPVPDGMFASVGKCFSDL